MVHKRSTIFMLVFVLFMIFILQSSVTIAENNTDILTYEGNDFSVEVIYGKDAAIPKDAYLTVKEISQGTAEYEELFSKTEDAIEKEKKGKILSVQYLDVSIRSGEEEIEPDEAVKVAVRYKEGPEKKQGENLEIIHFVNDEEKEFLDIEQEEISDQTVEEIMFHQNSFSVIGMIIFSDVDTSVKQVRSETISEVEEINITKKWSDGVQMHEDDEVTVALYELNNNNWTKSREINLNSENGWSGVFTGLDINMNYSISETKILSENVDKTDTYESTISTVVTKKWSPVEENRLTDGKEIVLVFYDGKYKLLRRSSQYDEMNLRMNEADIKTDALYGNYIEEEISTTYVWKVLWDEMTGTWAFYHTRGEAYLELQYDKEKGSYRWATTRERTEGTYLRYENGLISGTVNGITKYLGNITAQGPYEALDENDSGIAKFEAYEYRLFRPAEYSIFNKKNDTVAEEDVSADIITEKTIDYLGDENHNPDTDVDDGKYSENILKDLYRLNLNMEAHTDKTGLDLLLVMDVSSSMKGNIDAKDENGNPIQRSEALRQALNQFVPTFLQNNRRNRISIVAFEMDSMILQNWTSDSEEIISKINYEENGEMPLYNGEGTNYEAALARAHEVLCQRGYSSNAKAMIFLSDGRPTVYISGNDEIEPGNVTIQIGDADLSNTGINGTLSLGLNYIWEDRESAESANEAIQSFKRHNPEIMTGVIAFNTSVTSTLRSIATDLEFVTEIENGSADDLIRAMELITEFVPEKVVMIDELSENVELYKEDPDYKITVTDGKGNETVLYTSEEGLTEEGKIVLDNKNPVILEDRKIQMTFRDNYAVENLCRYRLSFNVRASQSAFNKFADSKGNYTDKGDEGTDYSGNHTSSGEKGYFSNGDHTKIRYFLNGAEIEKNYRKPVIQVREGSFSVKKTDLRGNVLSEGVEFALYRDADEDEEGEYTLIYEGKTDQNGEILFDHLRLSVFDTGYTYYLIERESLDGYIREENPIEIMLYENDVKLVSPGKNVIVENTVKESSVICQVVVKNAESVPFQFTKVDMENHKLDGAEFDLYRLICKEKQHEHENDCWEYADSKKSNPDVVFDKMASGNVYKLVEVKAPKQYVSPEGYWILTIDENKNIRIDEEGNVPDLRTDEEGNWVLLNEKSMKIPATGGCGTRNIFIVGIILITGGIFMLKKSKISKLVMMFMTLVMGVHMISATAFAIEKTDMGSITVHGVEENASVSAYRLMDINFDYDVQQPKNPMYMWTEDVAGWMSEQYPDYIDEDNKNAVNEAFSVADEGVIAELYDKLAVAIKDGTVAASATEVQSEGETVVVDHLEMGNYFLLIEGGAKVYRPLTANVVPEWKDNSWEMSCPSVSAKASEPSITKEITGGLKEENINIGDKVSFVLNAVVPSYPEHAKAKMFVVSDQLSEGLTLVDESLKIYGVNSGKNDELLTTGFEKGVERTADVEDKQVSFAFDFNYESISGYESLKITYDAVLNENAVIGEIGNGNVALLDYSNNPYISENFSTDGDETTVYTYGMKVSKVDESGEKGLFGAEFTLSKDGKDILFAGENGVYHVAVSEESGNKIVSVDENGLLTLKGLDTGVYSLTEVKAPDGYVKLQNPIEIVITDQDVDGKIESGEQEISDGYLPVTVKNDRGFTLPVTGGIGTTLFHVAGVVLMGSGILLIAVHARKRRNLK